ncbi:hypothetical protein Cgig2_009167 [Carnegiea gigantea]|uniref:Uncharacterized protein n=1 Tax=Carnegiea gigantea TaxID=171969 RepID=A0A9Q1KF71_9CARY|nr:hypothetical protein Cgig2_021106 [Carnegiea gigantea]KAJ8441738.1 hypothetical protein Cgig2_009167 [Carnegiea gigantea]
MGKRTFVPLGTLGMNRSQGLKQPLLRPSSSRNKHSHNGTSSIHEEENVSYAAEAEIDGCNSMNNKKKRCNFKPRGPNRCKRLANLKNGEKLEQTYFHNHPVGENHNLIARHMGVLGGKEGKTPTVAEIFKDTRQLKSGALDEESASKLEEIIQISKDNPDFLAFELVEECFGPQDHDHVACFGYRMKLKDVRGPLPTRATLQAML